MNAMVITATTSSNKYTSFFPVGGFVPSRLKGRASSAPQVGDVQSGDVQSGALQGGVVKDGLVKDGLVQSQGAQMRVQLTRRGRFVLFGIPAIAVAAVMVFVSLAIILGSIATPAQASAKYPAVDMADYAVSVTVLQGDSLWSIARASNPNGDVRDVVREIVALNELGSGVLQAGQHLYVPISR
ncbi:LysM peptidoglycan-binding domain-containing protein [Arthrobacter antibioticus]|uniref:LysM peptidoglycan-binding domain-containing protein n=1 Tax=Arthrobacter sp. H35-MC1 TaxID=3046203 RepID=UPI0024BBCF95|nr:LysM peptidoglycan-binding domain-containing protein [Arthrobacter sp. H35-MC1]MDJ0317711.1 LysM peptidoglycan-binding domain-containing protein [Arthrobacter sp. H35-MC1]